MARVVNWVQQHPDLTLHYFTGIFVPPHQRLMIRTAHRGAPVNVNISSRGTSKSSAWCVLYANYHGIAFKGRKIVTLSATGFRGGQMIFADADKWFAGGWDSQAPDLEYFPYSVKERPSAKSFVSKQPSMWTMQFKSFSENITLPTTDEDMIRGVRGHVLFIDESNTFDDHTLQKVVKPFLNVKGDFEHGGAKSRSNAIYYSTTIDYQWRDFQNTAQAARDGVARDFEAQRAARAGNWDRYRELSKEGLQRHTYVCFDYQDTIVRRHVTSRTGAEFEIVWPNQKLEWYWDERGLPFSKRGPDGQMLREDEPRELMTTYPINKDELEASLFDGTTDEAIWMAEQKNVVDSATGDVYPWDLLERVACAKRGIPGLEDYYPQLLWESKDPCVLGVDVATGQRDFAAFTVIRLGPLAKGKYDTTTHQGNTTWSNVVWCEQYRQMSHRQIGEKIRELARRYNLAYFYDRVESDTWKVCRAIGMDMKGGGSGVRDALVFIDDDAPPPGQKRIYDPLDQDDRILAFHDKDDSIPMLDTIQPSDQLNDRCVEFTLAQMKVARLYIAKPLDNSQIRDKRLLVANSGVKTLVHQLQKIQQEPTKFYRKFTMPGSEEKVEGKKDMFSSFLYASKQLRAHLIRQDMLDNTPPPMAARLTQVGINRGSRGRSPGAKY